MKKNIFKSYPILSLLANLAIVYILFTLCRLVFLLNNWGMYADTMTLGHALYLFSVGIMFDTTAILYTNLLVVVLMLLPLHWKECTAFHKFTRWIYVIFNGIAIIANLSDAVYFPFTGKRTTTSVFAEFGNEGAGNMTKIFSEQILANWYLVVIAAIFIWVLWKFFMPLYNNYDNKNTERPSLLKYYIVQILSLGLAIPLSVAGVRGGFSHAVRPITISNANQFVDRPAETGIVLNTPFSIYRTLNKKPLAIPDYMSDEEAQSLFSPIHTPNDSVAFQPKNVVVLILESFSKQHFGFYNRTLRGGTFKGFTPFLDSLIVNHAMTWQYSYANGRKSIEGMPSTLSSLPNFVEPLFLTPASLNRMSGLARELGEKEGYTTAFFHGAQNNSMGFQAFARATGFERYYGRTEYNEDPNYNGDADYDGTWAIWDEEFLQFYADRMSEMKEPFMTAVFTASSHTPFNLPERYVGRFPKGDSQIQECVAYSDHAVRKFFEKASKQPWFNNTLFVITADHTSSHDDPYYLTSLGRYCVPIIFYAPGDTTLHGYDTQHIVEQADIMPTVLSYLHYNHPYLAFGKDMFNTPSNETHALHWVPESSGYEFVMGNYVLEFDGQNVNSAFEYKTDSTLAHNVKSVIPTDTLDHMTKQMKSIIQQYMQRMNRNQLVVDPQ
ncbi:MAG: LTA synthase family protein [Bacteroidales bacterium]|nr:LTA synthase family protein [Bacteroidales bacterium]